MKLKDGLKLFVADVIDEETGGQEFWYVVDDTHDSALKSFVEWANEVWNRYAYYFYEADEDTVENFIEINGDVEARIYD
jgi:hypothetical protein